MKKNFFVILHELIFIIIQILCWTNDDVWGYTYGVALIWCGQVGLMLTWVLCLMRQKPRKTVELIVKSILLLFGLGGLGLSFLYGDPLLTTALQGLAIVVGALMATPLCLNCLHGNVHVVREDAHYAMEGQRLHQIN